MTAIAVPALLALAIAFALAGTADSHAQSVTVDRVTTTETTATFAVTATGSAEVTVQNLDNSTISTNLLQDGPSTIALSSLESGHAYYIRVAGGQTLVYVHRSNVVYPLIPGTFQLEKEENGDINLIAGNIDQTTRFKVHRPDGTTDLGVVTGSTTLHNLFGSAQNGVYRIEISSSFNFAADSTMYLQYTHPNTASSPISPSNDGPLRYQARVHAIIDESTLGKPDRRISFDVAASSETAATISATSTGATDVTVQTLDDVVIFEDSIAGAQDIELADLVAGHAYYIVVDDEQTLIYAHPSDIVYPLVPVTFQIRDNESDDRIEIHYTDFDSTIYHRISLSNVYDITGMIPSNRDPFNGSLTRDEGVHMFQLSTSSGFEQDRTMYLQYTYPNNATGFVLPSNDGPLRYQMRVHPEATDEPTTVVLDSRVNFDIGATTEIELSVDHVETLGPDDIMADNPRIFVAPKPGRDNTFLLQFLPYGLDYGQHDIKITATTSEDQTDTATLYANIRPDFEVGPISPTAVRGGSGILDLRDHVKTRPDGLAFEVASATFAHGRVSILDEEPYTGRAIRHTPAPNFVGESFFTLGVVVQDRAKTFSIPVQVIEPPEITTVPDLLKVAPGRSATVHVLDNDIMTPAVDELVITRVGTPSSVQVTHNGSAITYTAGADSDRAETINYTAGSAIGVEAQGQLFVYVTEGNAPPVAGDFAVDIPPGGSAIIDLAAAGHAYDYDGQITAVSDLARPAFTDDESSVSLVAGHLWLAAGPEEAEGTHTIDYTIADDDGVRETGTVTVNVAQPASDGPPVAQDFIMGITPGQVTTIDMAAYGYISDAQTSDQFLETSIVDQPAMGAAAIDGIFVTYDAPAGFAGTDSFTYTVNDTAGGQAQATVTVIDPAEFAAYNDVGISTPQGTAVDIDVLANDDAAVPDVNTEVTVRIAEQPAGGNATVNEDNTIRYRPGPFYTGVDTFRYSIEAQGRPTQTATVTVLVEELLPESDPEVTVLLDTQSRGTVLHYVSFDEPGRYEYSILGTDGSEQTGRLSWPPTGTPDDALLVVSSITDPLHDHNMTVTVQDTTYSGRSFHFEDDFTYYSPHIVRPDTGAGLSDEPGRLIFSITFRDDDRYDVRLAVDMRLFHEPVPGYEGFTIESEGMGHTVTGVITGLDAGALYDVQSVPSGAGWSDPRVVNKGFRTPTGQLSEIARLTPQASIAGPPAAADFVIGVPPGQTVSVDLAEAGHIDDSAQDAASLAVSIPSPPAKGSVVLDGVRLSYTAGPQAEGSETLEYTVTDADDNTDTGAITVEISAGPPPPNPVGPTAGDFTVTVGAGGTILIDLTQDGRISHPMQVAGTLNVSAAQPSGGTIVVEGTTITYSAGAGTTGPDAITYTVTDADSLSDSGTITVTISQAMPGPGPGPGPAPVPVPGPAPEPALRAPDIDIEAVPGSLTSVNPDIGEGGTIESATGATMGTIAEEFLADGTIGYTANAGASGIDEVTYMVSGGNETAQGTVYFYINAEGNERPALKTIPGIQTEGTATFAAEATDGDDTSLTYIIRNAPDGATIDGTGAFSWDSAGFDAGDYIFNVVVHDDTGGLDVQKMAVTVRDPANDNPTAPVVHRRTTSDTSILIAPDIRDPEGQPTGMILAVGAEGGTVSEGFLGANIIAYIPQDDGTDIISYTTSDGAGGATTSTVYVHTGESANPDLDAIGVQRTEVSQPLEFQASASDEDGTGISYIMDGAPAGATLDESTGAFSWTPGTADAGDHTFTITAYDSQGGFDTEPVAISVSEPGTTNRDPNITDFDAAALQNNPRFITLRTSDPDEDPTGIILATNATTGTIRQDLLQSGIIAYVPETDRVGVDAITYAVSDRRGGVSTGTIYVHIKDPVNDEPTLAPIGNRQVSVPGTLTFDVTASDNEDDPLTYAIRNAPAGATIDSATGTFSWTPTAQNAGDHTFTVTVRDDAGGFATEDILVTVIDPQSDNQPPTAPDESSTTTGDRTVIFPNISDPDGDDTSIIAATGAFQGLVDSELLRDSIIAYTPFPGTSGTDTITYTVSDGNGGLATGTITITITGS